MASSVQGQLERLLNLITCVIDSVTGHDGHSAGSLALASDAAVTLPKIYWNLPLLDRKTVPSVKRVPKLLKGGADEPYSPRRLFQRQIPRHNRRSYSPLRVWTQGNLPFSTKLS